MVTVGADAHALVNSNSSYMGLDVGEKINLRDLLYGLVLPSGNDAAVAIADAIGGNVPNFVAMMNRRAQQLGLTRTHYANPHGLDAPGHYTTAHDLAVLSAFALRNPTIKQVVSSYSYDIPQTATHKAYHLVTGNDLLPFARAPYPGAIGVKPGFTGNAGYTMAFAADRRSHLLVGAVLNDPSWQVRIVDMRTLLDWGYQQFGLPAAPSPTSGENPSPNE
jgi:D-alanyl-D-alanine carboxypeptidase (penicillin-binding protein 5/6)